jgi:hypothetical protein
MSTITIYPDGTFEMENAPVEFLTHGFLRSNPSWDRHINWDDAVDLRGIADVLETSYNLWLSFDEPAHMGGGQNAVLSTWRGRISFTQGDPDSGPEISYRKVE